MKRKFLTCFFSIIVIILNSQNWERLNNIALDTFGAGDINAAIEYCIKAMELTILDSNKATSANNLGYLYQYSNQFEKSSEYYNIALELREKCFGKENPRYCESLNNAGLMYYTARKYDLALSYMMKCEPLTKKVYGAKSFEYFRLLSQIGTIYFSKGDYSNAANWYLESVNIGKAVVGENNQYYAQSLNSIGVTYFQTADFEKSEKYLGQALEIRKKLSGTNNLDYGQSLGNLALLYTETGKYKEAEEYNISYLHIINNNLGTDNAEYAKTMNNLAELYRKMGIYKQSEKYFDIAVKTQEGIENGEIIDMAKYLSNMSLLYSEINQNDKSEQLRLRAFDIIKENMAPEHPYYAIALNNLATFYIRTKSYDKAEQLLKNALDLLQKNLGDNHPVFVKVSINLASLYTSQGKYQEAKEIYKSCEKKWKLIYGSKHPDYTGILLDMGIINENTGEIEKATEYYNEMLQCLYKEIKYNFSFLSESEKTDFIEKTRKKFDYYNMFVVKQKNNNPELTSISFENNCLLKGMLMRSENKMRNDIISSGDTLIIRHYQNWTEVRTQLTKLYSAQASEQRDKDIAAYENYSNAYEKELNKYSQDFNNSHEIFKISELQKHMKEEEAIIDFISITFSDNKVVYYAIILKKSDKFPEMVELFDEDTLTNRVNRKSNSDYNHITAIYGRNENLNTMLYETIWKPLNNEIENLKNLDISPTGLLHKINFAAIAKEQNIYLSDLYEINIFNNPVEIANTRKSLSEKDLVAGIFGGIYYNNDKTQTGSEDNQVWKYLNGTKIESENISKILMESGVKIYYFSEVNASEEKFKDIASQCNILHITTHGFFFPEPEISKTESEQENSAQESLVFRGGTRGFGVWNFVSNSNPMMRSGIVFAGANDVWNKEEKGVGDDGVLTAQEVLTIDLQKTELVVLSACETGLGDIKGSEGVYGLQRAFKMAGVKYIIMSLWQVPDKETVEFMEAFYKKLLKLKDIRKAFLETQKEMRKKYDPYFWAAFVLIE
ncbi:MAG: CHAT domain-containing tetratricopeptide repeat protein [Bacteroidota bacterium]